MANFPSLEPTTRALTLGDYPQLVHEGSSGGEVRFVQGTDRISQVLTLGYEYLTEAEAQLLLDHFATQQGSLIAFDLPSIIWATYSTPPISSSDYQWRYADSFEVGVAAPLRYNVSVQLEAVPI
jgi:hypothetical protein